MQNISLQALKLREEFKVMDGQHFYNLKKSSNKNLQK